MAIGATALVAWLYHNTPMRKDMRRRRREQLLHEARALAGEGDC